LKNALVVLGPTASGKTAISVKLAKEVNGEIISADSMQIYKYMDIGTAKPDESEKDGIPHYMMDEIEPDEEFSVARFKEMATGYIKDILARGKVPIIVGGTGLYINSLVYNVNFSETICDWKLREQLQREAKEKGNKYLHDELRKVDAIAAESIHYNNVKRVIRALEVFKHTNKPISYHQKISRMEPSEYYFYMIGLNMDREKLYNRINLRVDQMIENGLVSEVKKLLDIGYDRNLVSMQGLGYKEIISFLKGECTLEEAITIIKRDTRRYAKRQLTWFRRIEDIYWVSVDKYEDSQEILENIKTVLQNTNFFCKI